MFLHLTNLLINFLLIIYSIYLINNIFALAKTFFGLNHNNKHICMCHHVTSVNLWFKTTHINKHLIIWHNWLEHLSSGIKFPGTFSHPVTKFKNSWLHNKSILINFCPDCRWKKTSKVNSKIRIPKLPMKFFLENTTLITDTAK